MEETKLYKFSELCSKIGSGATPKGGKESYLGGEIALIRSQNVLDLNFSMDGIAYINEEQAQKLNNVSIQENDVLLNITGDSVTRACLVPRWILPARVNQHVSIIRGKKNIVLNDYLLYYLQYKKPYLLSISQGGATRNALTKKMIEDLELPLPQLSYQKKVVSILRSLDNKIELNRRINDNLEQQAQALFKSWFVDFEPFKEGKFVESELGIIPEGWSIVPFNSFISPISEKVLVGNLPEYSVTNNGIIPRSEKYKKQLSSSNSRNKVLRKNNLVFGMSREILNWGIMMDKIGGVSSAYNIYSIDSLIISPLYLKYYIESHISYFNNLIGTAAREGQALDKGALNNKIVYIPTHDVWNKFLKLDQSLRLMQKENLHEIFKLEEVRSSLLPKLMSGELKINDLNR